MITHVGGSGIRVEYSNNAFAAASLMRSFCDEAANFLRAEIAAFAVAAVVVI